MTRLRFFHSEACPYARRTRFVLEHLGLEHEEVKIDLREVPKDYREQINPLGRVPGIDHDGFALYESNTINEYLVEAFGGTLMPKDARGRARVRLRMALADERWAPLVSRFLKGVRRGAAEEEIDAARRALVDKLDELESLFIGEGPFMMGEAVSLADVAFFTPLAELAEYGVDVRGHGPRLARWVAAVDALPAYQVILGEREPSSVAPAASV
jgi:glutathione S-transferase